MRGRKIIHLSRRPHRITDSPLGCVLTAAALIVLYCVVYLIVQTFGGVK